MADPLNDPTPIPAGGWITVVYSQNLLGALNVSTDWATLANGWPNYITQWPTTSTPCIQDTGTAHHAAIQVNITDAGETVASVAAVLNAISPDVSILAVYQNGSSPADATTFANQCNTTTTLNLCLRGDVLACLKSLLGGWFTVLVIAIVLFALYILNDTRKTVDRVTGN